MSVESSWAGLSRNTAPTSTISASENQRMPWRTAPPMYSPTISGSERPSPRTIIMPDI